MALDGPVGPLRALRALGPFCTTCVTSKSGSRLLLAGTLVLLRRNAGPATTQCNDGGCALQ